MVSRSMLSVDVLHEALRQARSAIIITDAEMNIIYVNRVEMGYKREDVIGRRHGAFVPPAQRHKLETVFERARATGRAQHYETFLDAPDGKRHYYSNQISSYDSEDGGGMISIMTNVSRQREAEVQAESLQRELMEASHRAGMAEISTGVLHDVGNVLNSANVSAQLLVERLGGSRLHLLGRAVEMLQRNSHRLTELLVEDPKGRKLPLLVIELARELDNERARMRTELSRLRGLVEMMRSIVAIQRRLARVGEKIEPTRPDELVRRALSMYQLDLESRFVQVELRLDDVGTVMLDEQAALQVLVNLISNAMEALEQVERRRTLAIRLWADDQRIHIEVEDNGCGISPGNLGRLFEYGFSTKPSGHGFGLHTSSIAVQTMNGTLEGHSDGPGRGSRFHLSLPRINA